VVSTGQKICLEAGANFTGTIFLNGGTINNCASTAQNFTLTTSAANPNGIFDNYGVFPTFSTLNLDHGITLNNYATMDIGNLDILSSATVNNFGVANLSGYLNLDGQLDNDGTLIINGDFIATSTSDLINTGDMTVDNLDIDNTWYNSGTITSATYSTFTVSSVGTIDEGCLFTEDWTNNGSVNGLSCGDIFINANSFNGSNGNVSGDIALIDATPPGSAPFIDTNNGTLGAGVVYESCSSCGPEEICFNSIDDNLDGRIDEVFPGGIQRNMQLWLKANTGTNTTTIGSNVTSWADQSVNGYSANADVNATDWPTYSDVAINYQPGIDFDGDYTDDFSDGLHLGSDYIFADKEGLHVFIVCDPNIDNETDNLPFDFGLHANGGYGMFYSNDDYGVYTNNNVGGTNSELLHTEGMLLH